MGSPRWLVGKVITGGQRGSPIIEAFDPATFDALLEEAQPVLDSMTFG